MSGTGDDKVGEVLGGRYRLVAPIGAGSSGNVYRGRDLKLEREVAVKVLHGVLGSDVMFLRRFQAEARAAAQLSSPYIVAVYDSGTSDGLPFLVLELLDGGSLREHFSSSRPLSLPQIVRASLQVASGLAFAHAKAYVHRDLKPANLLFSGGGDLKIADFGLAVALSAAAHTEPVGVLMGTAKYASPEQARGVAVGAPSDLYSLGLIMYEAIAFKLPFVGDTTFSLLMARLDRDVEAPAGSGGLGSLIERCLRSNPEERITALELVRELDRLARTLEPPETILPLHSPSGPYGLRTSGDNDGGDRTSVLGVSDITEHIGGWLSPSDGAATAYASSLYDLEDDNATSATDTAQIRATTTSVVAVDSGAWTSMTDAADGTVDVNGRGERDDRPRARRKRILLIWVIITLVLSLLAAGGAYLYASLTRTTVPNLVGLSVSRSRAVAKLSDLSLLVTGHRYSLSIPQGDVIGAFPRAGVVVAKKSIVDVTLSLGPAPVKVPPLVGEDQAEIVAQLTALHFKVAFTHSYSETVPSGQFVSAQPAPGAVVQYGSTVQIVLSKGPVPRKVPNLVGDSQGTATSVLASEQLEISVSTQYSNTVAKNDVISQATTPGSLVPRGSTIDVSVSLGPHYVTVPNVLGDSQAAAEAALQAAGLTVGRVFVTLGNTNVILTSPAYGTQVLYGSAVSMVVD